MSVIPDSLRAATEYAARPGAVGFYGEALRQDRIAESLQAVSAAERDTLNALYGDDVHFVVNPNASNDAPNRWFGPYFVWNAADRAILTRLGVAYRLNQESRSEIWRSLPRDVAAAGLKGAETAFRTTVGAVGRGVFGGVAEALGISPDVVKVGAVALAALLLLK